MGPNSVPARDKALYLSLLEMVCDVHAKPEQCERSARACAVVTRREWLRKRNRLRTGKTR